MVAARHVEKTDQDFGLKDEWTRIEQILKEVIPVYERVNRFISLGTDLKIRKEGISLLLKSLFQYAENENVTILDVGSGPGKMSEILTSELHSSNLTLVQLDALIEMMKVASQKVPLSDQFLGVYEYLPFARGSFSAAMAGFAIRDARNLSLALSQICTSIRAGGFFLIVDLSKPDSKMKSALIGGYWRVVSPLLATFASPKLGRKFASLHSTYKKLPTRSQFVLLAKNAGFEIAGERYHMMGGSSVILLRKARS
jgi:demethylmenaquinone methyltransferase / 2-methoxy-6-polyprenyl-1,4-benzoquinol methylase